MPSDPWEYTAPVGGQQPDLSWGGLRSQTDADQAEYDRHVSELLAYLLRPQWGAARAVKRGLLDGEGVTGAAKGLYEGLIEGKETYPSYDVLGMPRPQETDSWPAWLAKGGTALAVDAVADPLIGIGKLGKLARLSAPYRAASEAAHSTGMSRWLAKGVPKHREEQILLPNQEIQRLRAEAVMPADEAAGRAMGLMQKEGVTSDEDLVNLSHNFQRGQETGVSPELTAGLEDLLGRSNKSMADLNVLEKELELPITAPRTETEFARFGPKVLTKEAERALARGRGFSPYGVPGPEDITHAEMQTLVDPLKLEQGIVEPLLNAQGKPIVSKPLEKYGFTQADDGTWLYTPEKGAQPVRGALIDATIKDIYESGMAPGKQFVSNPAAAYATNIRKLEDKTAFLRFVQKGLEGTTEEGPWLKKIANPVDVPENWRALRMPGFTQYAAPKSVANFIESRGRTLYNVDWFPGKVEQAADALVNKTKLGQMFKKFTGFWKKSVLAPFLGYYTGNLSSNFGLLYTAGVNPIKILQHSLHTAPKIQLATGSRVFENMTNAQARREFATRGLGDWAMMGVDVSPDVLGSALGKSSTRRYAEKLPEGPLRTAGEGAAWAVEGAGKVQTKALQYLGGIPETNARMVVALDWLEKQGIKKPTAKDLDRAALYAKDAMIDYEGIMASPTAQLAGQAIPFWAWQKGIVSKTLEQALERPERLARFERALDTVFQGPTDEQERAMAPWMSEQSPTFGAFGKNYGYDENGNPNMMMVGRFHPYGTPQSLASRPWDYAASIINPGIKGPFELFTNYSSFKNGDIDEVAGGFPNNMTNWITGEPYARATTKPFGVSMPAAVEYTLSQAPGGRAINALSEMGRSAGLWQDEYKSEMGPGEFLGWFASGNKTFPFDQQKAMARKIKAADKKAYSIKGKLKFAAMKQDEAGVLFYQAELAKHERDTARAMGFVSGDTDYEED